MPLTDPQAQMPSSLFTRRNFLLLGIAVATIGAGYAVLVSGSPSMAAVLLVLGYCILFPLALLL